MRLFTGARIWWIAAGAAAIVAVAAGVTLAVTNDEDDALVVYNGRSHYGGEEAFASFTRKTGIKVKLFGGDAESLFQRLRSEGASSPADILITVDGANLSRAKQAGLLMPIRSPVIEAAVPAGLRDADGAWTAVSTRVRTPIRSTTRVPADAVRSYEDLGDPRWRGRLCLRTSNNIYNQSLVADFIAKRGAAATEKLLRSWMANEPVIRGTDVDVVKAIAAGECDVGLVNHYYLARELKAQPSLPVAPAWPTGDKAGAHANLSGVGVVKTTDRAADAQKLVEFLVQAEAQQAIAANGEFPANKAVPPPSHIAAWAGVAEDPIDVDAAGRNAADAVALMAKVQWR